MAVSAFIYKNTPQSRALDLDIYIKVHLNEYKLYALLSLSPSILIYTYMGGGNTFSKSSRGRVRIRQDECVEKVITYDNHAITSGFGYDLLARSGWVEGQSLGARKNTVVKPIPIVVRTTRAGIGSLTSSSASSVDDDAETTTKIEEEKNRNDDCLVFDPLRPRCRYNSNHVCASLKALQKHERNCPANRGHRHEEGDFIFPSSVLTDDE